MHGFDTYSHLHGFTPISFSLEREPAIEWADLRSYRFNAPFFRQTVAQWRRESSGPGGNQRA
jgi:hypothetical protein